MTSPVEKQVFRQAFDFALDNLIVRLKEAQDYLGGGTDLAAIGTLVDIDDVFADMTAAKRLFISSMRKP
jgi:hypothetical protein